MLNIEEPLPTGEDLFCVVYSLLDLEPGLSVSSLCRISQQCLSSMLVPRSTVDLLAFIKRATHVFTDHPSGN